MHLGMGAEATLQLHLMLYQVRRGTPGLTLHRAWGSLGTDIHQRAPQCSERTRRLLLS